MPRCERLLSNASSLDRRRSRQTEARKGERTTTRGTRDSPEPVVVTLPTASKTSSVAPTTPWSEVELGSMTRQGAWRLHDAQGHVGRMGVETMVSRASMSYNHLIPRYDERRGLQSPWGGGRRAAGRGARRPSDPARVYTGMGRKGLIFLV